MLSSPQHSCTSVGSQLIQQYRTLLLEYERIHPKDVAEDICSMCDGGNEVSEEWVCCELCEAWVRVCWCWLVSWVLPWLMRMS